MFYKISYMITTVSHNEMEADESYDILQNTLKILI